MLGTSYMFLIRLCSSDVSILHSDVKALHGYANIINQLLLKGILLNK